jgi:hypothetical protein
MLFFTFSLLYLPGQDIFLFDEIKAFQTAGGL